MADKVEWQFSLPKSAGGDLTLLAKCGHWVAEFGRDKIYSEGEVFVRYDGVDGVVPAFFGQKKTIPEPDKAMALIAEVSQRMVERLRCSQHCECKCQNVYVVSLNEGDFEKVQKKEKHSIGIHFRLLPRYQHDEYFLKRINPDGGDNDGLSLMAEWREQYLLREKTGKWGWFPQPKNNNPLAWCNYVNQTIAQLQRVNRKDKREPVRRSKQNRR